MVGMTAAGSGSRLLIEGGIVGLGGQPFHGSGRVRWRWVAMVGLFGEEAAARLYMSYVDGGGILIQHLRYVTGNPYHRHPGRSADL